MSTATTKTAPSPMPAARHSSQSNDNHFVDERQTWSAQQGTTAARVIIPPPPTIDETLGAVIESAAPALTPTDSCDAFVNRDGLSVATLVPKAEVEGERIKAEGATYVGENIQAGQQSTPFQNFHDCLPSVSIPSQHVPFMGYMDENGVVHAEGPSIQCSDETDIQPDDRKILCKVDRPHDNSGEDRNEILGSAEDVLQASLTFEKSHPGRRFSSSLDQYYVSSTSKRHLYPSLDDLENSPKREASHSRSQTETSIEDIYNSTTSSAPPMVETLVPEPPGEPCVAAVYDTDKDSDDDDVKIGPAGGRHTYAVASLDHDTMAYASAEATVLGTSETPDEALIAKLEQEDAELVALKRSAYWGEGQGINSQQAVAYPDQQATVVAITEHNVHPSDISSNAVRAELIGEENYSNCADYSSSIATTGLVTSVPSATSAVVAVEDSEFAVVDSEATIIEQQSSWLPSHPEEAVVINDDNSIPFSERKLPAVDLSLHHGDPMETHVDTTFDHASVAAVALNQECSTVVAVSDDTYPGDEAQNVAFANEEAEIIDITEEYHPAEVSGNEAEAELVGAVAVAESGSAPVEATAEPSLEHEEIQAATVLGYEDDNETGSNLGMTCANSCGTPRPERIEPVARAYSAPSAVGMPVSVEGVVGSPNQQRVNGQLGTVVEEDWMRTPSLAGSSDDAVYAMPPPRDGEDADQPAVAVASLEAYSSASAPFVDETDCSTSWAGQASYEATGQAAVHAASLNAYASAQAPDFDPTDCHQVNRARSLPETPTATVGESTSTAEPAMPPPRSLHSLDGSVGGGSVGSSASNRGFHKISNSLARGMEMLFGDAKSPPGRRSSQEPGVGSVSQAVTPRELLPWSVIFSTATNMWVATVNTNQKALDSKNVVEASKSLRAYSVNTERQATCLAKAWSPPRMHSFKSNPACHICKAKFAVFRRAAHCRNCGVCICNSCCLNWPSRMVPDSFNIKRESFLNICKSCDWLCTSFRLALLEGDLDKAIALHATGNVNLTTPFANVKGELFYPVHCAALGGNLELLKWLVETNCCPLKSVRVSGRCHESSNSFTEITTSKGRSLLGIALENRNVGIVRYLVVDKKIQLSGEKDVTMDTLCLVLTDVLKLLPEDATSGRGNIIPGNDQLSMSTAESCEEQAPASLAQGRESNNVRLDTASDGSVDDACIICFDATIDCVATPCGHQICCHKCSKQIERCPVCSIECTFMRVFRP